MPKNRGRRRGIIHRIKDRWTRGFTLVELMVVVGILAFVIGISISSLNVQRTYESAQDSRRKSDVEGIHKALIQYFIDNKCAPLKNEWDNLECNQPVPSQFQAYFSTIPCDPETGEKYYVEFLNKNCHQCNGGCGNCTAFRVLTELKYPKGTHGGVGAGCDEERGCGIYKPNGKAYNYGLIGNNACILPTPTAIVQITPTNTPIAATLVPPTPTLITGPSGPTGPTGSQGGPSGPTGATGPTPTAFPTTAPFQPSVWIISGSSAQNQKIVRLGQNGTEIGPPITNPDFYNLRDLTQVGVEVWILSAGNDCVTPGTCIPPKIFRYNKDGTLTTKPPIIYTEMKSPKTIARNWYEVWVSNGNAPENEGIIRFSIDGAHIGNLFQVNDLNKPIEIEAQANTVWVIDSPKTLGANQSYYEHIYRLNVYGVQYMSAINLNNSLGNYDTFEGLAEVPINQVWTIGKGPTSRNIIRFSTFTAGSEVTPRITAGFPASENAGIHSIETVMYEIWVAKANYNKIYRYNFSGTLLSPTFTVTEPINMMFVQDMH